MRKMNRPIQWFSPKRIKNYRQWNVVLVLGEKIEASVEVHAYCLGLGFNISPHMYGISFNIDTFFGGILFYIGSLSDCTESRLRRRAKMKKEVSVSDG
jgi:hypothetical protein